MMTSVYALTIVYNPPQTMTNVTPNAKLQMIFSELKNAFIIIDFLLNAQILKLNLVID